MIEKFIQEHRNDFDLEIPSEKVWNSISEKLAKNSKKNNWKPYVAAACIMFFISLTWLSINNNFSSKSENITASIPEEVKEAQVQFASIIELKKNEIKQYKSSIPLLVNDFESQLVELQKNYYMLLPQLKDHDKKDYVMQAVIENLQLQVDILNKQLEILTQIKNTTKNEKNNYIQL